MKKNISINISGIIFHIEEDAYERLRDYLDSINRYFSSFDDSMEIIADIESRIAEIFLSKLNENKQVINKEDVEDLVATMGSIKDFQAIEEPMDEGYEEEKSQEEEPQWKDTTSRKFQRDEKRKLIAGVCAGIGHYFSIDPLWIRLVFIILFFGSYGTLILAYLVLWFILPPAYDLKEDKKIKKLYRDPDGKEIAGVSSGIANYFGVDVMVVRLLFIISGIFGFGILAYIILWAIVPEARSVTEKVQMKGEPVTLSNIESNIKNSLKVKDGEEENIFVKILLFPFRVIGLVIEALSKALGPILLFIIEFIRIIVGAAVTFAGIGGVISMMIVLGVVLGLFSTSLYDNIHIGNLPIEIFQDTFPATITIAGFFALLIPFILLILLGISVMAKRIIFNAVLGWSLFAIFIVSVITISIHAPAIAFQFSEEGEYQTTQTYTIKDKIAYLDLREVGLDNYHATELRLRGYTGDDFKLEQRFVAQGSSRKIAVENAQMVSYNVEFIDDSVLLFDSNIQFKDEAKFRAQHLNMTLYIPYNQPFRMSYDLRHIIRNTIYRYGYRVYQMDENVWMFTDEGLICLTCEEERERVESSEDSIKPLPPVRSDRSERPENYDESLEFTDFEDIEITGAFIVTIDHDDEFSINMKGDREAINDMEVYQNGNKLYIEYEDRGIRNMIKERDAVKIYITMPELEDIEVTGATKLYVDGFENQRRMKFVVTGASYVKANIEVRDLTLELTGASEMQLDGSGQELTADIMAASQLNAYGFEVETAKIEANAASSAKVYVTQNLDIEERLGSNVKYKGNAAVRRERGPF